MSIYKFRADYCSEDPSFSATRLSPPPPPFFFFMTDYDREFDAD